MSYLVRSDPSELTSGSAADDHSQIVHDIYIKREAPLEPSDVLQWDFVELEALPLPREIKRLLEHSEVKFDALSFSFKSVEETVSKARQTSERRLQQGEGKSRAGFCLTLWQWGERLGSGWVLLKQIAVYEIEKNI